ncbi:UNVERIFIED_CONTAM: hypothetical protein NCL1_16033 [Trichonephila clavipes]
MPDIERSVDAELGTVQVSQQLVEMPDIERSVDAELGTVQVSQQLLEMPDIEHDSSLKCPLGYLGPELIPTLFQPNPRSKA